MGLTPEEIEEFQNSMKPYFEAYEQAKGDPVAELEALKVPWSKLFGRYVQECAQLKKFHASVPLFASQDDGTPIKDRSGICLAIGKHHFILSAEHDIREYHAHKYYVFPPWPYGAEPSKFAGTWIGSTSFDIAALNLSEATAAKLAQSGQVFLRISDLSLDCVAAPGLYALIGFPNAEQFVQVDSDARRLHSEPLIFMVFPIDEAQAPPDIESYDPMLHLLLHHNKQSTTNSDGEPIVAPRLDGMSGCGIWRIARFSQAGLAAWSPDECQLVAIQASCKHGSFIRATWVIHALRLIEENCPECAPIIRVCLGGAGSANEAFNRQKYVRELGRNRIIVP